MRRKPSPRNSTEELLRVAVLKPESAREAGVLRAGADVDALRRIESVALDEHHAEARQRFAAPADGGPAACGQYSISIATPSRSCIRAKTASTVGLGHASRRQSPAARRGRAAASRRPPDSGAAPRHGPAVTSTSSADAGVRTPDRLRRSTPSHQRMTARLTSEAIVALRSNGTTSMRENPSDGCGGSSSRW